ncbi:hypothetical protein OROGR_015654 [Orobanche gracilis]
MEKAMRLDSSSILMSSSFLSIVIVIIMLLLILILFIIACKFKPWRRFLSRHVAVRRRSPGSIKRGKSGILQAASDGDDIERPLISGDLGVVESQNNESTLINSFEHRQTLSSIHSIAVAPKQRHLSAPPQLAHNESFILDIPNTSEGSFGGQTLKRPLAASQFTDEWVYDNREDISYSPKYGADKDTFRDFIPTYSAKRGSILMLEVISGPSRGLQYTIQSTNTSKLPVTIGRVSPSDVILKDSEVSGKHVMINWNINKLKWDLVDMGSLNGTTLNSQTVHLPQSGGRYWSNPVDLSSGDIITLGTRSKILVNITVGTQCKIPFGIGIASDPMALRRGGKKLPMEDVCYYQWPLLGMDKVLELSLILVISVHT